MGSGFGSLLILLLHHTVNHYRTVKMSLSEQRAVVCFVTEGETRFRLPKLWFQERRQNSVRQRSLARANTVLFLSSILWICAYSGYDEQ